MSSNPLLIDVEGRQPTSVLQPKVTYAGDEWGDQPYTAVQQDSINLVAGKTSGIAMSDQFGVTIGGKLSISMMPNQISMGGGYWRVNPLILSCVPSTTPTPIPFLIKDTPRLLQAASDISSSLGSLISQSDAAVTNG